jgi:excisionase family DNA binding protein
MAERVQRQQARSPRFLSVAEVACIFGVSDLTVYREIRCGRFPAIRFRGRYVVPARAVEAMEDAAVKSGALVDPSAWVDGDETASDGDVGDAVPVPYPELDRPRPGANQTGAGSFSTQHVAGYGEDATGTRRRRTRGGVA